MINNISFLRSIKPKYSLLVYLIFISVVIIISSLFVFKSYDVYKVKGYVSCVDKCSVTISVNYLDTNKYKSIKMIKINKENMYLSSTYVSDILLDEVNKSNYQVINYEVSDIDSNLLNTFQDITLYANEELIINKIVKVLL